MEYLPEKQENIMRRQIYLLTCWQERDEPAGKVTWRFNIETPGNDKRWLFANLQNAFTWIKKELESEPDAKE